MKIIYKLLKALINIHYSTVTDLAKFFGWSTSVPFATAVWYASNWIGIDAIIGVISFPVLLSAALLLIMDRSFGTSFLSLIISETIVLLAYYYIPKYFYRIDTIVRMTQLQK